MIADPFTGGWTRDEPACWSWPVPDTREPRPGHEQRMGPAGLRWLAFHDGRCALCGLLSETVEDHDHATGLVRGMLCRGCNTTEGRNLDPDTPVQLYRDRPPAAILGHVERYRDPYTGRDDHGDAARPAVDRWRDNPMLGVGL